MVSDGRPLLVSTPALVGGAVSGGITTRRGFPAATRPGHDDPSRAATRDLLARLLGRPVEAFAWARQVHSGTAVAVDGPGEAGEADGLVTTREGLVLLVAVADCGPVLLTDRAAGVVGAAHAGWRGCVAGIVEATVDLMVDRGARRDAIEAWVGPCIGPGHFEVGEEVAGRFPPECVRRDRPRPYVDLPRAIHLRLLAAGLDEAGVRVSGQCTYALEHRYWSYRRDGGICGRQLAWIVRDGS